MLTLQGVKHTHRQLIPSRKYAENITHHILTASHPLNFQEAISSYPYDHRRHKTISSRAKWEEIPTVQALQTILKKGYLSNAFSRFATLVDEIAEKRFSPLSSTSCKLLKRTTKYSDY
eukprot:GHVR01150541.1.p1 GENE.GHVR01150541.1~~GHVR01150541.1.p1  ORF type:complete len:118 (+),score=4.53 GHVR01150541.1:4668-5021(+)